MITVHWTFILLIIYCTVFLMFSVVLYKEYKDGSLTMLVFVVIGIAIYGGIYWW